MMEDISRFGPMTWLNHRKSLPLPSPQSTVPCSSGCGYNMQTETLRFFCQNMACGRRSSPNAVPASGLLAVLVSLRRASAIKLREVPRVRGACLVCCSAKRSRSFSASFTELLVDADVHNQAHIEQVLSNVQSWSRAFRGQVFAAKRLKKWKGFFEEHDLAFHPVSPTGTQRDPVDDMIIGCIQSLALDPTVDCIAVLTSDTDFVESLVQVRTSGTDVRVFIPEGLRSTIMRYEDAGLTVIPIRRTHDIAYTVKATLHADGHGCLQQCDPLQQAASLNRETEMLCNFLTKHAYRPPEGARLIPCIAKFWFANSLGDLTVFPNQCAIQALYKTIRQASPAAKWTDDPGTLAFLFPMGTAPRSKLKRRQLGGARASKIAKGPGPSMIEDSPDLAQRILRKLGYLDDSFNSDLVEALQVFVNSSENKRLLRTIGAIPDLRDADSAMATTLRQAFLSSGVDGSWQQAPSDRNVRQLLLQHRLLPKSASKGDVFKAMQQYARKESLETMKTYNGLVWRIVASVNAKDPCRRDVVSP
ncbi:unnamed protein product [Symbiodinium sp. CCMP2592]|nr:unnamed protein product [Symbiodinium sp. CCMP2592]